MAGTTGAARTIIQFARIGQGVFHEILHRAYTVLVRKLLVDDQYVGHRSHEGHRRKVTHGVVRDFAVKRRIDRMCGHSTHHERVAIGLGFGDEIRANISARSGTVFNNHWLTECGLDLLCKHARNRV